jgi:hypothetical protein
MLLRGSLGFWMALPYSSPQSMRAFILMHDSLSAAQRCQISKIGDPIRGHPAQHQVAVNASVCRF